jgi:hypothetical protein
MFEIAGNARQMDGIDTITGEDDAAKRTALPLGAEFELVDAMEPQPEVRISPYAQSCERYGVVEKLYLVSRAQLSAKQDRPLSRPHAVAPRQINGSDEEQSEKDSIQFHRVSKVEPEPHSRQPRLGRGCA